MEANSSVSGSVTIRPYTDADHVALVGLLLELHRDFYSKNASALLQEINKDKDIQGAMDRYVSFVDPQLGADWLVLLAVDSADTPVGFIMGSLYKDDERVLSQLGELEDWYIQEAYRHTGAGMEMYRQLEAWFKKKGCTVVTSETWNGNGLSLRAHEKSGFAVSGILFSKKI